MSTILITGGSGYLGRHLASRLKGRGRVVIAARNQQNLQAAALEVGVEFVPLDVANIESVRDAVVGLEPEIIVHAAASKFVDLAESQSMECVDVNVVGSQNVARVAASSNVELVVGVSTDKATPPTTNIYGMTKALMERIFTSFNGRGGTKFTCIRGGNITWSSGSVFPIWKRMLDVHGVIESTGPDMTRFFFSVEQAADLVATAIDNIERVNGRILVCEMAAAKMRRILDIWTEQSGASWRQIEPRPGDHSEQLLVGLSELQSTELFEIAEKVHYLITPNAVHEVPLAEPISSSTSTQLTDDEIREIIDNPPLGELR